jgi:hypothetical protein
MLIVNPGGRVEFRTTTKFVRIPAIDRIGEVICIMGRGDYQIDLFCRNSDEEHYVPLYHPHEVEEISEMEFLAEALRG